MNCQEITLNLQHKLGEQVYYLGCYNAEEIMQIDISKQKPVKPIVFIANILPSDSKISMGHWVCMYLDINTRHLFFFDSFALSPDFYSPYFINFIVKHKVREVYTSLYRIQSDFSLTCGLYCIMFVHKVSRLGLNSTLLYLNNVFSKVTLKLNDRLVLSYARHYLPMKQPCVRTFCRGLAIGSYQWCKRFLCETQLHIDA